MAIRQGQGWIGPQIPHDGQVRCDFHRFLEEREVPLAADPVEQHPGYRQGRVESGIARRHRGGRARHPAAVDDQQHRRLQLLGHGRGAALLVNRRAAVEQPHHPFDDREIAVSRRLQEDLPVDGPIQHPAIQVPGRSPGDGGMVAWIDEVGPDFEGLDPTAASPQGREQRQRHGRLPHIAVGAPDDEPWILVAVGHYKVTLIPP